MEYSRLPLPEDLRDRLRNYVFDIISCMHAVHQDIGNGLPEYVYQEALMIELRSRGFNVLREYSHHPIYKGQQLQCAIKMDLVVCLPNGNVIVECKAISSLTEKERAQTLGYLRGTDFPIALLVNFGTKDKAQIERYYYKDGVVRAF